MLNAYSNTGAAQELPRLPDAYWIDLLHPTREETASVEARLGLILPSRNELSQVELSSRLSERNGVLFLSMPTVSHLGALDRAPSPLGFVLSEGALVTIRYTDLRSFDAVAQSRSGPHSGMSGIETFVALVDAIVDQSADLIEQIASQLDEVSRAVFAQRGPQPHVTQSNDRLREVLVSIGNAGERLSRMRDSVLGLQRIVPYVAASEHGWISAGTKSRLKTIQGDLSSLTEYESHLSDKVQFLLDAVLGFINTRQNDIFQLLTVISIVGIPPTLVAGIYGMNFRNMPELSWSWGYPFGLLLILLSAVLPMLWFRWRKWI